MSIESKEPNVSIILVNYNGFDDTIECIESILANDYKNYRIIIVDNGSANDFDRFSGLDLSNHTTLLRAENNLGFSGGNNIGIDYAIKNGADYILLLNNDTLVERDFLVKLIECSRRYNEEVVITPKIMYWYDKSIIWYAGGEINGFTGRVSHTGIHERDSGQYNGEREVSFISGCCMLIPALVYNKVGKMDEEYFLYCEDLDYCFRLKHSGIKLIYCPDSKIYHKVSASTTRVSNIVNYYSVRNKRYIIKKYYRGLRKLVSSIYNILEEKRRIIKGEYTKRETDKAINDYKNNRFGKKQ